MRRTAVEIPLPNEAALLDILKINSTRITKRGDIDYESVGEASGGVQWSGFEKYLYRRVF
jgi:ATP-dependent 26S proteasome regulatory subunit